MRVLFAPGYRTGNPYQTLLAKALHRYGIKVSFLTDYYGGLPLWRGVMSTGRRITTRDGVTDGIGYESHAIR